MIRYTVYVCIFLREGGSQLCQEKHKAQEIYILKSVT